MESTKNDRLVEGFGNVSIIDNQGDFVPIKRMAEIMPIYMRRGAILMDSHTNRHIGTILNWELRDKEGKDAIYLWAKIFNDFSIDDMVWKAIGDKHYTGFSFGGRSVSKDIKCSDGACFNNIKDLEMWEWSTVPKPANKESIFTKFNELAKGDKMSTVLVPRVQDGSVIYDQVDVSLSDDMLMKSDEMDDYEEKESGGPGSRGPRSKEMGYRRNDYKPSERTIDVRNRTKQEESEKMEDYQSPELDQETEKMDEYTEKAGSQSRGPRRTKASEYSSIDDIDDVTSRIKEERGNDRQRVSSRQRMNSADEAEAQSMGSKWGRGYEDIAGQANREQSGKRIVDKAKRIGARDEVEKEDSPMAPPSSDAGNPMNKILSLLESIDGRLTALEGGNEEKAELEDMPPEAEKAETPKKVTVPEPPAQQEVKTLQKGDVISQSMLNGIAGELKKMGYEQSSTPRPSVSAEYPFGTGNTVGDLLNKSDSGRVDIHSQLGSKSFKELDQMFRGN